MARLHQHQDFRTDKAEEIKLKKKLPEWAEVQGLWLPPHLSLEQCSSEETAKYKSHIVASFPEPIRTFTDLTGGFGVDSYYIGRNIEDATYVEHNEELCNVVKHNYELLGSNHFNIVCADAVEHLKEIPVQDLIFIDPARRNECGLRTYDIKDCTPDVKTLNGELLNNGRKVMIKLSPMFDWHKAVNDLVGVTEVHIVAVKNECKELLLILQQGGTLRKVVCVNGNQQFCFFPDESAETAEVRTLPYEEARYLYEPNAAVMKAGCFKLLASRYGVSKISGNSHLFLSNDKIEDFPGRGFYINNISSLNKKEGKAKLSTLGSANITVRNFPMTAEELRKRLKLRDGGETYLFATTTCDNKHIIFVCEKINN